MKDNATEYTQGFRRGYTEARLSMIRFLESHLERGADFNSEEMVSEIRNWLSWDDKHGLTDYDSGELVLDVE